MIKTTKIFIAIAVSTILFFSCEKETKDYPNWCGTECYNEVEKGLTEDDYQLKEDGTVEKQSCFEFVFPITVNLPNDISATVNTKEELKTEIKTAIDGDKALMKEVSLVYPIEVIVDEDKTVIVNKKFELFKVIKSCKKDFHKPCFKLNFPVDVLDVDGTQTTIVNFEDLKDLFVNKTKFELVYPVDVTFIKDETIATVNTKEDMINLKKDCE